MSRRKIRTDTEKRCSGCEKWLPLDQFPPNTQAVDGLGWYCHACARERRRAWQRSNPDKVREARKRYLAKLRERHETAESD